MNIPDPSSTQSDHAFITFLGTSNRARMSPDEQRLFDFHKGRPGLDDGLVVFRKRLPKPQPKVVPIARTAISEDRQLEIALAAIDNQQKRAS